MPDLTTRQGYRKPLDTEQFDIAHQNYNWDKADLINGVTIATSGTRPGTPSVGMMIYETDTGQQRVWNGTTWVLTSAGPIIICTSATRPSPSVTGMQIWETDTSLQYICTAGGTPGTWTRMTPVPAEVFGYVGGERYTTVGTLGTITTAEALAGMDTGSQVLEANKTYMVDVSVEVAVSVATTNALLRVRDTNLAGAIMGTFRLPTQPVTTKFHYNFSIPIVGPTAGARTYVLTAQRDVGTPTITITSTAGVTPFMAIRKVGSNTLLTAV